MRRPDDGGMRLLFYRFSNKKSRAIITNPHFPSFNNSVYGFTSCSVATALQARIALLPGFANFTVAPYRLQETNSQKTNVPYFNACNIFTTTDGDYSKTRMNWAPL